MSFKKVEEKDCEIICSWFNEPHVQKYYSLREWSLSDVKKKILPYLMSDSKVHPYLYYEGGEPIGYCQFYAVKDFVWNNASLISKEIIDKGAGIDCFIGDKEYLSKGYGKKMMSIFLSESIWPRFCYAVVDPDVNNTSAKRFYTKLGFELMEEIQDKDPMGKPVMLSIMVKKRAIR